MASALLAGIAIIGAFSLKTPEVRAFWPFSSAANADDNGIIPSSDTPVLAAAIASDPNPDKGLAQSGDTDDGSALMADAGPSGTSGDIASTTDQSTQISVYVVQPGDTLSQIAQNFGVSVNTIAWANNLSGARAIHPGETLVILPVSGIQHTVVKGDTLASVAKKYAGDPNEIADYNGLDPTAPLVVGSQIIIPGGELSALIGSSSGSSTHYASGSANSNPYRGGSGPEIDDYYANPVPGALLTNGLHGENAVDLAIARGTSIRAAADGTVIIANGDGAWNGGYGNYVVIKHDNGTETLYAHMTRVAAKAGEQVSQGDVIGYVGMTGDATGPHVHFEVRGAMNPFGACSVGTRPGEFSCD